MDWIHRILMQEAENDGAAGGGGTGTQTSGEPGGNPAGDKGGAPTPPQTGGPGEQLIELKVAGKTMKLTLEQVIARAQRTENITRREQELARQRDDFAEKQRRLDQLLEEAERGQEQPGDDKEIKSLKSQIAQLAEAEQARKDEKILNEAFKPVLAKHPDVDQDEVLDIYLAKTKSGELPEGTEGLLAAAAEVQEKTQSSNKEKLEKLLADDKNPIVQAHNEKVIRLYREGKIKLSAAGGERGGAGSGAGAGAKEGEDLSQVAARLRGN
jgi:hypothetical protein